MNICKLLHILGVFYDVKYVGVIVPENNVKPSAYENIAKTLVTQSEARNIGMDIYIANVTYPDQDNYTNALDEVFDYIHSGYKSDTNIFMIGHSDGAYFGLEHGIQYANYTIQMGSLLNSGNKLFWGKGHTLISYPRPILTLLGKSDGFLKWTLATDEFDSIDVLLNNFGYDYISKNKPIIIMNGVNHMDMANGIITESAKARGIVENNSSMPLQEVHNKISYLILDFITKNSSSLISEVYRSNNVVKKYKNIYTTEYLDLIISDIQSTILNNAVNIVNILHTKFINFIYSKPHFVNYDVVTQSFINVTNRYNFSNYLWLKMKKYNTTNNVTATQINKFIYDKVFGQLTQDQIDRYKNYGKKLLFGCDINSSNWLNSTLNITHTPNNITVRSPVFITYDNVTNIYQNMFYVKVMTPSQIYDWLVNDAFN